MTSRCVNVSEKTAHVITWDACLLHCSIASPNCISCRMEKEVSPHSKICKARKLEVWGLDQGKRLSNLCHLRLQWDTVSTVMTHLAHNTNPRLEWQKISKISKAPHSVKHCARHTGSTEDVAHQKRGRMLSVMFSFLGSFWFTETKSDNAGGKDSNRETRGHSGSKILDQTWLLRESQACPTK